MATVTGITAEKAREIADASITAARLEGDNLVFVTAGGAVLTVGRVVPEPYRNWPIGSIYMSERPTNPNASLGGGTWARYAKGRSLIGVDEADPDFATAGKLGGRKTVSLTREQMPKHTHDWVGNQGGINANFTANDSILAARAGSGTNVVHDIDYSDAPVPTIGWSGEGQPHDNVPPFITVYIWIRTG